MERYQNGGSDGPRARRGGRRKGLIPRMQGVVRDHAQVCVLGGMIANTREPHSISYVGDLDGESGVRSVHPPTPHCQRGRKAAYFGGRRARLRGTIGKRLRSGDLHIPICTEHVTAITNGSERTLLPRYGLIILAEKKRRLANAPVTSEDIRGVWIKPDRPLLGRNSLSRAALIQQDRAEHVIAYAVVGAAVDHVLAGDGSLRQALLIQKQISPGQHDREIPWLQRLCLCNQPCRMVKRRRGGWIVVAGDAVQQRKSQSGQRFGRGWIELHGSLVERDQCRRLLPVIGSVG